MKDDEYDFFSTETLLKWYLKVGLKNSPNGIMHIQRTCRIGFNAAYMVCELGLDTGLLEPDPDCHYKHIIVKHMGEEVKS